VNIVDAIPFDKALEIALATGKASTSSVQRKLKIGHKGAGREIDFGIEKDSSHLVLAPRDPPHGPLKKLMTKRSPNF
jgi:DNA segregation ATPase FtsK/SpoIIIE-like protein